MGGDSTAHKNLFVDGYFDDMGLSSSEKVQNAMEEGKRLMSCDPVMESRIRNQTCVLGELFLLFHFLPLLPEVALLIEYLSRRSKGI